MKYGHDLRHYPFLALEQEALLPPVDQKRCLFFWDMLLSTRLSGYAFFLCLFLSSVTQFMFIQKSKRLYGCV